MEHRVRTVAVAAVMVVVPLLAAGCGDGDEKASDGTGADRVTTTTDSTVAATTTTTVPPAVASTGCDSAAAEVVAGEERVTLTSGGVERWYFRHVPPAHDGSAPVPLVVDLHGYSEGAEIHKLMSGLGEYGDEHGFVTATPHGLGEVPRWDTSLGSADLAFVGDLLDQLESNLCLDTSRIYVTGLSNGAMMTSAVACAYADRVAAVAPVAGIMEIDGCDPARAVPVVTFHGTDDGYVAYDGGLGERVASLPAPDGSDRTLGEAGLSSEARRGPSIPEVVAAWAVGNGCEPEPAEEEVAADVHRLSHACPEGAEVELYRVDGGGHTWPGSDFSASIESIVGPTTMSIVANDVMWEFFTAHPLPAV